ncbi:sarcosine oxidase subunit gamma [Pseudorhodobacter sp. E13]|uniref:sarcosine oxidase subunit gamma n=1 Tax=Pseudorhodobacter sp. E13 TaxID=2487931 RepID=UPI001F303B0F|nr:sarcosine oxidase subunit gamma [Pseudorhodobacter sp. E13]
MADLIAKSPLAGRAPTSLAGVTLAEADMGPVTSVAPFAGQDGALAAALAPLAFPAPNSISSDGAARLVWTARGQAFLIGAAPGDWGQFAALTDQSDGWACLTLSGSGAAEVLSRLVPLDLRAMAVGSGARSSLGHMAMILIRGADGFEIMVFRSMARTAWHELEAAMKMRAARQVC